MDILIKIIELLTKLPVRSCKFCMAIYRFVKSVFIKCYIKAIVLLSIITIIYYGSIAIIYNKEVIQPAVLLFANKEAINVNSSFKVATLIKQAVIRCGKGVTISWGVLTAKNLTNYEKTLEFPIAIHADNCSSTSDKICDFDSKLDNPAYWNKIYHLENEDGLLIESDQIRLTYEKAPFSFKELEPIIIPIYSKMGLSLEMRSLQHRAPILFEILSRNPVVLNSMQKVAVAKVRNNTIKNKFVIFLVFATKWGDFENSCTDEGLKQAVFTIAERLQKTMVMF